MLRFAKGGRPGAQTRLQNLTLQNRMLDKFDTARV